MKYTKARLQRKTTKQLIDIILKLQNPKLLTDVDFYGCSITIADGTQGMKRGE